MTFNLSDQATDDDDFIVNIQGTDNTFEVQDGGTSVITVADGAVITLNGATTVSANRNFTMASGTGLFSQSYSGAAANAHTINGTFTSTTNGNLGQFLLTNNTTSGTQQGLLVRNVSGSTGTTDTLAVIENADDTAVTTGLQVVASSSGAITTGLEIVGTSTGTITTAIDVDDAEIVTALSVGANDIVGTTGLINYDNFDVDANGNITVAVSQGLDTNAAGALNVGNATANRVNIGTTAATQIDLGAGGALGRTINIGTGTGVDTIHIGDGGTGADIITIGSANAGNVTVRSNAVLSLIGAASSIIDFPAFDVGTGGNITVASTSGTGISFTNTGLTTDISLQNGETINNNTNGDITFTNNTANTDTISLRPFGTAGSNF